MKKLEKIIQNHLNVYAKMADDDPQKITCLKLLNEERKMLSDDEEKAEKKAETKRKAQLENKKLKLEKEKLKLEQDKLYHEQAKQTLEAEKFIHSKEQEAVKAKADKQNMLFQIIGLAVPAFVNLTKIGCYLGLAINAQRHDYGDFKLESKYSSSERTNLLK